MATRAASAMLDLCPRSAADAVAQHDHRTGEREQQRDEEEEEAGCEGMARADSDASKEAHEERLAHREPVQRERDEHDEEEQRPEDVIDPRIELDTDGF